MRKIRSVLSVLLIVFIVIGFGKIGFGFVSKSSESNDLIELAESYVEKKLYQKAINAYTEALDISESAEVREKLLEAYRLSYEDGTSSSSDITDALLVMVDKYPKNINYKEQLLQHYYDINSYKEAYDYYKKLTKDGVKSEIIKSLGNKVKYVYSNKSTTYFEYIRSLSEVFVVREADDEWNEAVADGEKLYLEPFKYIAPNNVSSWTVYVSDEKGIRLKNSEGVVEAHITQTFSKAKAYGDGFLPVLTQDDKWGYIDCFADVFAESEYDDVSSFTNGIAAVKVSDKWTLIDTNFTSVSSVQFDDVKLFQSGEYVNNNIMAASVDGKYGLFDEEGKTIVDPEYKDIDVSYGELVAFCNNDDKWGFINSDGKVVIEPIYQSAKSFSNGLAAVFNGEKWGFINSDGDLVIDYSFEKADYFTSSGTCMVDTYGGAYHFIELKFHE